MSELKSKKKKTNYADLEKIMRSSDVKIVEHILGESPTTVIRILEPKRKVRGKT